MVRTETITCDVCGERASDMDLEKELVWEILHTLEKKGVSLDTSILSDEDDFCSIVCLKKTVIERILGAEIEKK
jgi:hypothetical protein